MICTFFGHRTVDKKIEPVLRSTLIDLIENHDVNLFYVGNQGGFDAMVYRVLKELSERYPINYHIVLAYVPLKHNEFDTVNYQDTIIAEGLESVPKRYAIPYRNNWMLDRSDYVVTYVIHDAGSGAAKYKRLSEKRFKKVINLEVT